MCDRLACVCALVRVRTSDCVQEGQSYRQGSRLWRVRLLQAFPNRDVGRRRLSVNVLCIKGYEAGIVHFFPGQESVAIVAALSQCNESRRSRWAAAHSQLLDASPALSKHSADAEASNIRVAWLSASGRAADAPRRFLQRAKRRRPSAGVRACARACVRCLSID